MPKKAPLPRPESIPLQTAFPFPAGAEVPLLLLRKPLNRSGICDPARQRARKPALRAGESAR
jgi:hypothetical protein